MKTNFMKTFNKKKYFLKTNFRTKAGAECSTGTSSKRASAHGAGTKPYARPASPEPAQPSSHTQAAAKTTTQPKTAT
jgi:hypothetical protein